MRALCDKTATFFDAVQIIMQIEEDQAVEIPDSVVEQVEPWEELAIRDLVEATERCLAIDHGSRSDAEAAVISAIKTQYPSAPEMLPFDVPLLDAIAPDRDYGDSYD